MRQLFNCLTTAFLCLLFCNRAAADVTLSSEPVAASNVSQGGLDNIVYIVKADVSTSAATIASIQFTLTGTHDANDLVNVTVFSNTTPSLTGAFNAGTFAATFAAPHLYNLNITDFTIAAGTSRYIIIVFDVNASATSGNTIKLDGTANPVTFGYTAAQTVINNQTDAAGLKTIQSATVTYSTEPIAAGNFAQGLADGIVYIIRADVSTLNVTTTSMNVTLSGTHDANDLTNISIYTNSTPSLAGATNRGTFGANFAAPHLYNLNYGDFTLTAGSTTYFIITVDVSFTGTAGNTIKVDGAANPAALLYSTAPAIINNQTDVAGLKTIQSATVTYSSEPIAAGNFAQGLSDGIVYIMKADVSTLNVSTTSMNVTLSGTHDANDLTNISIYTNSTPSLAGATNRGTFAATFAAPHLYNLNYGDFTLTAGSTTYFIITVDVSFTGTAGNTIKVDGAANPGALLFSTAPAIINNQSDVAGLKTIQSATVTYSSEPVTGGNIAQSSSDNIVYILKADVAGLNVSTTSMNVTLSGTHDANDLTNIKIYTNSTPSLTGAFNRGTFAATFAAPHLYNINYGDFTLTAGSTTYFIIAVDVNASGTGGNTVKADGVANPAALLYSTAPAIINNQTDVAGTKTIQAAGVTYSSVPVAASNAPQGSADNLVYIAKVDVTSLGVTTSSMNITLSGTHDANDLTNINVYTNSTPSLTGATNRGSFAATFAAPHLYNINYGDFTLTAGSTTYFIITVDVSTTGTNGNTVKLDGAANPVSLNFLTAPPVTNNQTDAAGIITILAAAVTISSEPVTSSNIIPGSSNNILYIAKMDVSTLGVTATDLQVTLTGTHDNNDLTNIKVLFNSTPALAGASNLGTFAANFAAPHTYNLNTGNFSIASGATRYIIITTDLDPTATISNTVKLDGAANPVTFSFTTGPVISNNQTDAAGLKTISTVLPLTLVNFSGMNTGTQQVQLNWTTSFELNTKDFEVEWSTDGSHFKKVGTTTAAGNSNRNEHYQYLHHSPAEGINFYRLKMNDIDGRFSYSPVVKTVVAFSKTSISTYPNPVTDVLQITVQSEKRKTLKAVIYNAEGRQAGSKTFQLEKGMNQFSYDVRSLAPGSYLFVFGEKDPWTISIIKQ